jgi:hypothetical protein
MATAFEKIKGKGLYTALLAAVKLKFGIQAWGIVISVVIVIRPLLGLSSPLVNQ